MINQIQACVRAATLNHIYLHRRPVEGVRGESAAPGEYRKIQNYVVNSVTGKVIYTPPAAIEIPMMMSALVKWLNSKSGIHKEMVDRKLIETEGATNNLVYHFKA